MKIKETNPIEYWKYIRIGKAKKVLEDYEGAIEAYTKAIDINEMQNIWEQIKKNPRSFATRSKKPSKIFAYIVLNRWLQLNHEIIAND